MRKLTFAGRVGAVAAATMLAFSGTAFAVTWEAPTTLTLSASDHSVDKGDKVTFSGKLSSPKKKCEDNERIALYRGRRKVDTTRTDRSGHYSFRKAVKRDSTWQTRYKGHTFGKHPNTKHCKPSKSDREHINVT